MRAKAITCVLAATATLAGGCARLVVLNPDVAASRNDGGWKTGQRPPPVAPVPASAAAPTPADPVIVPLPAATEPAPAAAPAALTTRAVPFRERPEIQQALATPADGYGVPAGLYSVDPLLAAHQREMAARASSRRGVGIGTIVAGLVFGGLAALAFAVGEDRAKSSNEMDRESAGGMYFSSVVFGTLALGELIAGTVMTFTSSDSTQLQAYYRETYTVKP